MKVHIEEGRNGESVVISEEGRLNRYFTLHNRILITCSGLGKYEMEFDQNATVTQELLLKSSPAIISVDILLKDTAHPYINRLVPSWTGYAVEEGQVFRTYTITKNVTTGEKDIDQIISKMYFRYSNIERMIIRCLAHA